MFADNNRKIKNYEKRFGAIAIEKGFITKDNLLTGLALQVDEDRKNMRHRLLGEILFAMGVMTNLQIEEVLQEIFRRID
ncbi:MAG: hypothetical protein PHN75_11965 [Syntrophales bacterium]|nr:hypothetical protein [Syntrophales bacterium]